MRFKTRRVICLQNLKSGVRLPVLGVTDGFQARLRSPQRFPRALLINFRISEPLQAVLSALLGLLGALLINLLGAFGRLRQHDDPPGKNFHKTPFHSYVVLDSLADVHQLAGNEFRQQGRVPRQDTEIPILPWDSDRAHRIVRHQSIRCYDIEPNLFRKGFRHGLDLSSHRSSEFVFRS